MELYRFYTGKLTKEDYIHECYAAKGYLTEIVTLLEYQLSWIIASISGKFEGDALPADFLHKTHKKKLVQKIKIAEKLMIKHHADFVNHNSDLFTLLDKIRSFRNDIAHSLLDVSREKFNYSDDIDGIRFISIESNPINNNPNCPVKYTAFGALTSDISIVVDTCDKLRYFLKTEYKFAEL